MQKPIELPANKNDDQKLREGNIRALPGPKGRFLLGNFLDIPFDQFHEYLKEQSQQYGDIFRLKLANKTVVVLSNPQTVRTILKKRPDQFRRISAMQEVFSELGINGVFSAESNEWKLQRKMMNQAFNTSQIKHYHPIIINATERLQTQLDEMSANNQAFDFQALMQRYTIDITTQLAFGYDVNSLVNTTNPLQEKLAAIFPMISQRVKAPFPYWRYIKLKKDKELDAALCFIREQCHQFIDDAEHEIKTQNNPQNILQAMIKARDEEGIDFTQEQLFANMITLLLAGEDTTANTLSWIMHYLIQNPHYQQQLHQEIVVSTSTVDLEDYKQLDKLPFLNAVIQEAMRLMPVAPFLYVENITPQTIEGYHIPSGTMLTVLLSQTAHDNNRYSEANAFIPERWLNMPEEEQKQASKDLMHFGAGPRLCPGRQLSLIEIKYALINIFSNFTFSTDKNSKSTSHFAFTVMPQNLIVEVQKRV